VIIASRRREVGADNWRPKEDDGTPRVLEELELVCYFWTGVQINTLIILIVQYHLTTRSFVSSILQNFKDSF
jgi:hypothetical protein